jgi:DNA modification methylase
VHRLHAQSAAVEGDTWSQKQTGRLLGGMSVGAVNYCVEVARHLRKTDHPVHKAESLMEALRILCQIKEDEINKYESSFAKEVMTTSAKAVAAGASLTIDSLIKQNDQKVEITPSLSTDGKKPPMVIQLSNYFTHANCIEHMTSMGSEAVDHIITDAPYGIDMDMLNQQNPHGSMVDIDRVEDEHDVQANVKLFHEMYPRMFDVLKDKGFCVVWIDQMHWQLHYDLATKCGFKVQRWPLTWVKTHQCMNQSAQYNFTKATEVAIVCRKGNATIVRPQSTNVWIGTNDEARKSFGHPFAKPEGLWRWIFEAVAVKGQTIYDPFSGVGTCPLAAARAGYFPRGCELKDIHYNRLIVGFKELMGNWYSKTHDLSFQ